MKKILFVSVMLLNLLVISCKSDKKKDAPASENNYPGVTNSNGNIPDTTNSINLDNKINASPTKDSIHK